MLTTSEPTQPPIPASVSGRISRWVSEIPIYRAGAYRLENPEAPVIHADQIRHWPLLTKASIRQNFPENFLRNGSTLDDLLDGDVVELEYTAGTSEERTPLLLGRGWWAVQERRALQLNPHTTDLLKGSPEPRRLTITSPMCNNDIRYSGVPSRDERIVGNALFTSLSRFPFLWGKADFTRMAKEARYWGPELLDVDPAYGVAFALYCEREGMRLPSLRCIVASYEFVSRSHRRILERVFGVPVCNLYGSTETGHLLVEADHSEMRAVEETAWLELLPFPEHRAAGGVEVHELAVTTLTNEYMPLIRYRIGDLVERIYRAGETRFRVHGRAADAFSRKDGQLITVLQVDELVGATAGIAHYQLVEVAQHQFRLRYIPDRASPDVERLGRLRKELGRLLGTETMVTIEETDLLMPEKSGKFRLCYPLVLSARV